MRALLSLWVALALWLVPATAQRRVPGGGEARVTALADAVLDAARLPQRVEVVPRGTAPAPVRGGGTPAVAPVARVAPAWASASRVRAHALPSTARRVARPRRLSFPVEATAPPLAIS